MSRPSFGDPTICSRRVVAIESILQTSGRFHVDRQQLNDSEHITVDMLEQAPRFGLRDDTLVWVSIHFAFHAYPTDQGDDAPKAAVIEATYEVLYRIRGEEKIDEADLRAFATVNGPLNLTPYWREFVESCLRRANLPAFTVPPFNAARRLLDMKSSTEKAIEELPETTETTPLPPSKL